MSRASWKIACAPNRKHSDAPGLLGALGAALDALVQPLSAWHGAQAPGGAAHQRGHLCPSAPRIAAVQLHELLQRDDPAARSFVREHATLLAQALGPALAAVQGHIDQFDFEPALAALTGWLAQPPQRPGHPTGHRRKGTAMQRESMEDLPVEWRNRQTPTVLVVDDTPDNLVLVSELLGEHYRVKVANSGARALKAAQADPVPDLVLLGHHDAGMDGYEVCRQLKAAVPRDIPIIFLTARADRDDERLGLELGAVDYITKPVQIHPSCWRGCRPTWRSRPRPIFCATKRLPRARGGLAHPGGAGPAGCDHHGHGLLAETRDDETGNHIRRTQLYVKALAERLRAHPRFEAVLNPQMIELITNQRRCDIGKIGIPDHILLKPGKLTDNEFEV